MTLTMPDGQRWNFDQIQNYVISSNTIVAATNTGTLTYTDNANNATNLAYVMQQIGSRLGTGDSRSDPLVVGPLVITGITPLSFDITSSTITIRGSGFTAATVGRLGFEDPDGGQDNNGYYMTCTFVSETEMTAVFGSAGDGILAPKMLIYYRDSTGTTSNNIIGSNPSGTLITIP